MTSRDQPVGLRLAPKNLSIPPSGRAGGGRHEITCLHEPPKPTRVRPTRPQSSDAVIMKARKKLQAERKNLLQELRPQIDRPWTAGQLEGVRRRSRANFDTSSSSSDPNALSFEKTFQPRQSKSSVVLEHQQAPSYGAEVNEQKRKYFFVESSYNQNTVIRQEVWRQKFDFISNHVAAEMEREEQQRAAEAAVAASDALPVKANEARNSVLGGGAGAGAATTGQTPETVAGVGPRQQNGSSDINSSVSRTASSNSHGAGRIRTAWSVVATPRAGSVDSRSRAPSAIVSDVSPSMEGSPSNNEARREMAAGLTPNSFIASAGEQVSSGNQAPVQDTLCQKAGWRRANSRPSSPIRRPLSATTNLNRNAPSSKVAHRKHSKLRSSVSVPALTCALVNVRDAYYGGDELQLHEDILHCSNPKLFPLRPGHGRPLPLPWLVIR